MDPLIVRGHFRDFHFESGGKASRPILTLNCQGGPYSTPIEFLADTGADLTLIDHADAIRIWRSLIQEFDFQSEDPSVTHLIGGVGGVRCAWKEIDLWFPLLEAPVVTDHGSPQWLTFGAQRVLVAPPSARFGTSLLGWDLMERFRRIEFKRRDGLVDLVLF